MTLCESQEPCVSECGCTNVLYRGRRVVNFPYRSWQLFSRSAVNEAMLFDIMPFLLLYNSQQSRPIRKRILTTHTFSPTCACITTHSFSPTHVYIITAGTQTRMTRWVQQRRNELRWKRRARVQSVWIHRHLLTVTRVKQMLHFVAFSRCSTAMTNPFRWRQAKHNHYVVSRVAFFV